MQNPLRFLPLLLVVASPSAATPVSLSCDPWSAPRQGEQGPISILVTDTALTWYNDEVAHIFGKDAESIRGAVFTDGVDVILLEGSVTSPFVRRLQFSESAPISHTRCHPAQ